MIRCIFDKAECNPADSSTKREWKYNDIFGLNVKGVADAGVYWSADAFMREWGRGIVMHGIKVVIRAQFENIIWFNISLRLTTWI